MPSSNLNRFHSLLTDIAEKLHDHKSYVVKSFGNLQRDSFAVKLRLAYQEALDQDLIQFPIDTATHLPTPLAFSVTANSILIYQKGKRPKDDTEIYSPSTTTSTRIQGEITNNDLDVLIKLYLTDHFTLPLELDGQAPSHLLDNPFITIDQQHNTYTIT